MTIRRAIQIVAALTLLGLLAWGLDAQQALALLARADPRWLAAALAALTLQTALSAWRWQITAGALGQRLSFATALSEYYLAQIVNQSLPGGVIGDAGRALRTGRGGDIGLRRAGGAVAIERMLGQIALLSVLLAGLVMPAGPRLPDEVELAIGALTLGAVAISCAVAAHARTGPLLRMAVLGWPMLPRQIALNLAVTGLNLAAFACAARATGTAMGPVQAAVIVPLILLAMILPLTVAGWGLREGAAAAAFPLIGAAPEAGLAASLCFGLAFLAASLPGIAVMGRSPAITPAQTPTRTRT